MKSNRLGIILAGSLAMVALSSLTATAAQAVEGGPQWIVKEKKILATGETRSIQSHSVGTFAFKAPGVEVKCETATVSEGSLSGGIPGTGSQKLIFTGCALPEKSVAECGAKGIKPLPAGKAGEVIVNVRTALAFAGNVEARTSAVDIFAPVGETGNENLYVAFELSGTNCGIVGKKTIAFNATGTSIEVNGEKRKVGIMAQLGRIGGGGFEPLPSSADTNQLLLPFPAVTMSNSKAEYWNGKAFQVIESKLEGGSGVAEIVGLNEVTTTPEEGFGWIL